MNKFNTIPNYKDGSHLRFTSDTHFGHDNIIRYCNRPFRDSLDMDEVMIENWNRTVGENDEVFHNGDFGFGRRATAEYLETVLRRLNGKIHIMWGNHDHEAMKLARMFASFQDYCEITVEGQAIVMCHYAMRSWHHNMRGAWMLYGHTHNTLPPYGKSCDIGVDAWNTSRETFGAPVTFAELKKFMDKQPTVVSEKEFKCGNCKKFPCECSE